MTGQDGVWLLRFENRGKDLQSASHAAENHGKEGAVVRGRGGKNGEAW